MAATLLVVVSTACGSETDAIGDEAGAPAPVRTVVVTVTPHREPVRTSGVLTSREEMSLTFKFPGYVAEVLVAEGDRVVADQVLARLRSDEVDAQVRSAEARRELAARNLGRIERLRADSVATQATLDQARDEHERAEAALAIALFDQASATIRAPSDGRILERMIEVAEFVGSGTPAFRFGAIESGWVVRVGISDRQMVRVARGDSADVHVSALGVRPFQGHVSRISDAADATTGTFEVEVTLEGGVDPLRSGMVAHVTIIPAELEELSFLPTRALIDTDGLEAAVFVVEGDRVRRHPVRIVSIGRESVGVRAPELEGARVVTDGASYLRDGERIEDRTAAFPTN